LLDIVVYRANVLRNTTNERFRTVTNDFYLTLGQAAKATGKSKSTIFKALESGKLSYFEKTTAGYKIDPSELFRVFPKTSEPEKIEQSATPENAKENEYLKRENEILRQQLEREREQADHWRRQATALLTYQPEQKAETPPEPAAKKSGLYEKLFGRSKLNQ
jgi:hypothetical protein